MMKPHERILHEHGTMPTGGESEPLYRAYVDSGGHPQVSFILCTREDEMHLFQYSHFDNAEWKKLNGREYMYFTHRGKAVTMRGWKLSEIILALQEYRVKSLHEYDGTLGRYENDPLIERVSIVSLNTPPDYEGMGE